MHRHMPAVAGEHLHRDAQRRQLAHGLHRLRLGRIEKQQEALQAQVLLIAAPIGRLRRHHPAGHGQHTVALIAHALAIGLQIGTPGLIQRLLAFDGAHRGANGHHAGHRPLGDDAVARRGSGCRWLGLDHDGQALAQKVIGNLVDLARQRQRRRLRGGGADDGRIQRVFDAGFQRRIHIGQLAHPGRLAPLGIDDSAELHHPGSQGARLVGAQHVHAAQVLDRFEPAHDDAPRGHGPRAVRQGHADDGRQQLGRQTHRQRHREQQRVDHRTLQQAIDHQHEHHGQQHHAQQQLAETTQAPRESCFIGHLLQARGQPAQHAARPGLHHQHPGHAAAHRAAQPDTVGALRQRGGRCADAGLLFHRIGLAGQRRLRHQEIAGLQHHAIGRHQLPGTQLDHIARHQLAAGHRAQLSVAPDPGLQRQTPPQRRHRPAGAVFLRRPQQHAAADHGQDDGGLGPLLQHQRNHGPQQQDGHQRAEQLPLQQPPGGRLGYRPHHIRAQLLQTAARLGRTHPFRGGLQLLQELAGRPAPVGVGIRQARRKAMRRPLPRGGAGGSAGHAATIADRRQAVHAGRRALQSARRLLI